ncbi:unnamed protein product, partial [Candidula unifasciata]
NSSEVSNSRNNQTANVTGISVVSDNKKSNGTAGALIVQPERETKLAEVRSSIAQQKLTTQAEDDDEDEATNKNPD